MIFNELDQKSNKMLKSDKGYLTHEPKYEKIKVFWNKETSSPF